MSFRRFWSTLLACCCYATGSTAVPAAVQGKLLYAALEPVPAATAQVPGRVRAFGHPELLGMSRDFPSIDSADLASTILLNADEIVPGQLITDSWRRRIRRRAESVNQQVVPPRAFDDRIHGRLRLRQVGHLPLASPIAAAGIGQLQGVSPLFISSVGLQYRSQRGILDQQYNVQTVIALVVKKRSALIGQASIGVDGNVKLLTSTGLGYRHLIPGADALLGVNVFFDYLARMRLQRFAVGVELKTVHTDILLNGYDRLGRGEVMPTGVRFDALRQWDAEVVFRVPEVPWVELSAQYYKIDFDYRDSLEAQRYGIRLRPVPLFSITSSYEWQKGRDEGIGMAAELIYRPGVPLSDQLRPQRVRNEQTRYRLLEAVHREELIVPDRRPPPSPMITAS